ncbi:MAG TPA: hypothetical protein VLJ38_22905 [Polyangiaceae bacterium]|nr:hypothetical protein [Polyangiaceae bacterium]
MPASTCAADERTLMYFSASCEGGQCVYSTQTYACMGLCAGGACLASTTTTSGSPPPSTCTPSSEGTAGQAGDTAYTPGDCPIPASTCADASTLDYYVVQCVNGQCVTSVQAMRCAVYCVNGACQGNFTAR